jgi:ABC-2 type transport system ATP-binding protein
MRSSPSPTVSGADLDGLADRLLGRKGIDMVAPFGTSLHVAGRDAEASEEAIATFKGDPQLKWVPSPPSLEDVFIDLMARSQDNFQ